MLTSDVKDWIKTLGIGQSFYAGKLNSKEEQSIGVYSRKTNEQFMVPLGGLENKTYNKKPISVLVHWNRNYTETEIAAAELFEKLQSIKDVMIGSYIVRFLVLLIPEPVDVGTDEKGIYERVIEFDMIYQERM